jgi:hypothetical protein
MTSTKTDRVLHIMYFVDSDSTKTISVRIRNVKLAIIGVALFASASMLSTAAAFLLGLQLKHMEDKSREMKSALIAQSIVHDNLLKVAPFMVASGSNIALNQSVGSVAASLVASKAIAPNPEESSLADAEPADEDANPAIVKKVDVNKTVQTSETDTASPQQVPEAAASAKTPMAQLAEKSSMALAARANQAAAEIQKFRTAAATAPEKVESGPSQLDAAVVFDEFQSTYDSGTRKISFSFNIRKQIQNNVTIDGNFCAVISGTNSQGKTVSLVFPPGTTPEDLEAENCAHTYPVRLARFRPTSLSFISEPLNLESAKFLFESGTVKTLYSTPLTKAEK